MNATEILRELVAIPTVSKLSNRPLIDYVTSFLTKHHWKTKEFSYRDSAKTEKINLIATPEQLPENELDVELAFVCHTDTVPFAPSWTNATSLEERRGFLHGCGACDVKGSLAGILAAIAQCPPSSLNRSVALVLTAEEEIGCIGASHLITTGYIHPKSVIICEPTSLHPAIAGKGYGLLEVRITGRPAHSAFPQEGISAIYIASELIGRIERLGSDASLLEDPLFSPPSTTFNIGVVQGGTAKNVVPEECSFLVEWRPLPEEPPDQGAQKILQLARQLEAERAGCHISVEIQRAEQGFKNSGGSRLGSKLAQRLNRPETGIPFGSEATRFAKIAEEVVVIGPGDMHTAHSERECLPVKELEEWTDCVRHLLKI